MLNWVGFCRRDEDSFDFVNGSIRTSLQLDGLAVALDPVALHMVQSIAFARFSAVDHHVMEQVVVPRAFPDLRMHDQSRFQSDHLIRGWRAGGLEQLVVSRHHVVVPNVSHVAFEFRAKRTVVPETVLTAVDFGVLKDESSAFAQGNNLVH